MNYPDLEPDEMLVFISRIRGDDVRSSRCVQLAVYATTAQGGLYMLIAAEGLRKHLRAGWWHAVRLGGKRPRSPYDTRILAARPLWKDPYHD